MRRSAQPVFFPAVLALFLIAAAAARAQEFRALWVDAFHDGFMTASEVTKLVVDARAGHFNAIIPEVRKRGDAYYNSLHEPKATDVSPQSFDPLADLCAKAHNTNNGPRIEVHAWIVTYPIWGSTTTPPSQPSHPYNLHPDWLTRDNGGATWNGSHYAFDPGHPAVQQHTFNVSMDIISRYDVDGLNFDYVRYSGNTWGYNTNAVARFNARFNRTGQPTPTDSAWLQWRRDQVSALVRKVYLHSAAIKPHVKISADTICFAPGPTTPSGWTNSAAYTSVLQDWRAWMQEGILDLNIPMAYFDHRRWAPAWTNWSIFAKDHRYNRHLAIGPGIYLNTLSNVLFQMRHTRLPSPSGNYADGVSGYSYAVPVTNDTPASLFFTSLVQTNAYETNTVPIFPTPTNVPVMPWKAAPTRGHLKGFVFNGTNGAGFDGATVTLSGPTNRVMLTDASGFYGAVDLPVGEYVVTATNAGFFARSTNLALVPGVVTTRDLSLPLITPPPPLGISNVTAIAGARAALITWTTTNAASSQVEFGLTTNLTSATAEDLTPVLNHTVLLAALTPGASYHFAVVSRFGTNTARSAGWTFSTAGELILDNADATYTGTWSTGTLSPDKYAADYRFITINTSGNTASAFFTPAIATPGFYDVFVWYPQGGNRTTNAYVQIVHDGGSVLTRVNQETGGGGWRQVGTNLHFVAGTNGFVRIGNFAGDTGEVVMADAVRFVYRAGQDTPVAPTMPDWWALHYFGATTSALGDPDGDGYANWAEYLTGTAPDDPASRLNLSLQSTLANALAATFAPAHPGRSYQLQQKLEPTGWLTLTNLPAVPGPNGGATFTLTNENGPLRIYRLKVDWSAP